MEKTKKRRIYLLEHSSDWKEQFKTESSKWVELLNYNVKEIHHIGSTAIDKIKAKPVIDIMILIKSLDELDRLNEKIEKLGYETKGEFGIEGRRFFLKNIGGERKFHVHIFERMTEQVKDHIIFRDYLNSHPQFSKQYEVLKLELAQKYEFEPERYTEGKAKFINGVLKKAKQKGNYA